MNYPVTGMLLIISLAFMPVKSQSLNESDSVELTSSLHPMSGSRDQRVCPGDMIVFTCITRGSTIQDWSSTQYIQGSGIIEFTVTGIPGFLRSSDTTIATLISTSTDNNIIVSTLRIRAESDMTFPSVTCTNRNTGRSKTLNFQYLDTPGQPLHLEAIEIENGKNLDNCVIFVEWRVPENTRETDVDHYIVDFPSGNVTSLNSYVTFVPHIHKCSKDIMIRVRAVSRCGDVGNYSDGIMPKLLEQDAVTVIPVTASFPVKPIVSIILAALGLLFFVAISICQCYICYKLRSKRRNQTSSPTVHLNSDEHPLDSSTCMEDSSNDHAGSRLKQN